MSDTIALIVSPPFSQEYGRHRVGASPIRQEGGEKHSGSYG